MLKANLVIIILLFIAIFFDLCIVRRISIKNTCGARRSSQEFLLAHFIFGFIFLMIGQQVRVLHEFDRLSYSLIHGEWLHINEVIRVDIYAVTIGIIIHLAIHFYGSSLFSGKHKRRWNESPKQFLVSHRNMFTQESYEKMIKDQTT